MSDGDETSDGEDATSRSSHNKSHERRAPPRLHVDAVWAKSCGGRATQGEGVFAGLGWTVIR